MARKTERKTIDDLNEYQMNCVQNAVALVRDSNESPSRVAKFLSEELGPGDWRNIVDDLLNISLSKQAGGRPKLGLS